MRLIKLKMKIVKLQKELEKLNPNIDFFWQELHFKIICMSSGHSWTSSSPPFSHPQATLMSGLTWKTTEVSLRRNWRPKILKLSSNCTEFWDLSWWGESKEKSSGISYPRLKCISTSASLRLRSPSTGSCSRNRRLRRPLQPAFTRIFSCSSGKCAIIRTYFRE